MQTLIDLSLEGKLSTNPSRLERMHMQVQFGDANTNKSLFVSAVQLSVGLSVFPFPLPTKSPSQCLRSKNKII